MNPLASRLKSALLQQTQNVKFNILINSNLHNNPIFSSQKKQSLHIKSTLNKDQQQGLKQIKQKKDKNQQYINKQSAVVRLPIPQHRLIPNKELTIQSNIENRMTSLKKRSYSQRRLIIASNQSNNQLYPFQAGVSRQKRLSSASSSSKLKNKELNNMNTQLTIQKQSIRQKSIIKANFIEQNTGNGIIITHANNNNNNNNNSNKQVESTSRARYITPIKSENLTIMPFSIQPSTTKQALQTKVYGLSLRGGQNDKQSGISEQYSRKNIDKSDKKLLKQNKNQKTNSHNVLFNSLNSSLTIFVKDGILLENTLDFKRFIHIIQKKKQKNIIIGQNLQNLLQQLKNFSFRYQITTATIDVTKLWTFQVKHVLSNWNILTLFTQWKQLLQIFGKEHIHIPGIVYYYPDENKGVNVAANKIIKFFRFIKQRNFSKKLGSLVSKIIKIQRFWKKALIVKRHRQKVLAYSQKKLQQCTRLQQKFIYNYHLIKTSRKTQIHIGSLSFEQFKRITLQNKSQFQMTQISRIFKTLQNPDTFIIYVTPFQLNDSVLKYYQRLFKIVTGSQNSFKQKVYFVHPQNSQRISTMCELTTLNYLLCSPKALKRIKRLIKSISSVQNSYIIPSFPSIQYTNLSYELQIPLFSSSQNLSKLYSTKIGFREIITPIIQKQKSNPPFKLLKSISSIFSQKQLINTLALLIYKNQNITRWYFKIDDEFNSRGLAYFNVNSVAILKKINEQGAQDTLGQILTDQKQIIRIIATQLKQKLKHRLKIVNKAIYPTYNQYITHFLTRGGVIEAAPQVPITNLQQMTISFQIEPNGDFQILGTYRKLQLNTKPVSGTVEYPAKSKQVDVQKIVRHLYRRLYLKMKFFGYFSIDLLISKSDKQIKSPPYALGLNFYLTSQAAALFMIEKMAKINYDKDTNTFCKIETITQNQYQQLKSSKISKISKLQFQYEQQLEISSQHQSGSQIPSLTKQQTFQKNTLNQINILYCPKINLPGLQGMSEFFRKCKFENIAFDLKYFLGTVFLPIDDLECGNIGFMVCEKGKPKLWKQLNKIIEFLSKNYRKITNNNQKVIKNKNKNNSNKKDLNSDQVGMLRGVILADMHKSEQWKKQQLQIAKAKNIQNTESNLELF